jgi:AcrR family transcriptional regulator
LYFETIIVKYYNMAIEDTRDKILSVANKLFSRFGFHKTSMDEIAKIARKAKGSLYYHFASKEDLFKEVVSKEIISLKTQLSIIIEDTDLSASGKMKKYLTKRMEVLNDASNYHETLKADFFEHFHFIDDLRNELDEWEKGNLKRIILQGIETKEFAPIKDIDVLLDILIMVLKGLEIPFFLQNKYEKYIPYSEGLMSILTKGLAP